MYKAASIFITCILFISCSSPTIVNQKTIGGNDKDEPQSMCLTNDGGFIVAGNSFSQKSGEKLTDNRGFIYSDYWIIKFNADGNIQWQKTIGGDNLDFARSIVQTSDGGYIIAGESESDVSGDKTENCRGSSDIWVVKIDSIGNVMWDKTFGGSSTEICTAIKQTKYGEYIIAGASNSNISGEKSQNCHGDFDFWVLKLNNRGNLEWDKTIGGNNFEYCGAMELADDGAVVCGTTASDNTLGKMKIHPGCFVAKLDINGNLQWEKVFRNWGMFLGISRTTDNDFVLSGFCDSAKGHIWIVKIDNRGENYGIKLLEEWVMNNHDV
ncbi:MAG: hypothetical protein ABJA35_00990 [Parafilimonas sp.]